MSQEKLPDFNILSAEELQDEYLKLYERFQQLREQTETDAQCIHELKRNLDTATAAECYLSEALAQNNVEQVELSKLQLELEQTRKKYKELQTELANSQNEADLLQIENIDLRKQLELQQHKEVAEPIAIGMTSAQHLEREQQLQQENTELLQNLEEFQESTIRYTIAIAEREKTIEILRDQVNCLEENMQYKRGELEEVTHLLESTQEQLMEAKAQIAMLTAAPENIDRKGNSLFAEVDDQRQVMKQLLAAQKKSYLEMKKIYNDSEHEIRRLKRENMAMHTELETCSTLFCNADRTYQEKLKARILQLMNQKEDLEKQLICTQERLGEVASNKGVAWINSMLNFCKQETDELKNQLHRERFQCGTLEEQLRNLQQDMARWRFESLKSRCILMDRENLLAENKISFKPKNAIEFHINERQLQNERPRILNSPVVTSLTPEGTHEKNILKEVGIKMKEIQCTHEITNITSNKVAENFATEKTQNASYIDLTACEISLGKDAENKENVCEIANLCTDVDFVHSIDEAAAKPMSTLHVRDIKELQSTTPCDKKTFQSILCNDPFGKESKKTVKFSCNDSDDVSTSSGKAAIKKVRTKSSVIVKRITVSSKSKP